jgi:hypothetical protein
VLDRHQDRAAPLAADAYALGEAQRDEQQRGEHPDLREGRQETYEGRGDPHDEEREDQHGLAPDPVPVVPEDDAPHRPRHEADRVGRKREQRPGRLAEVREE